MEESGTKLHIPLVLKHFVLFPQKLSVCGRVSISLYKLNLSYEARIRIILWAMVLLLQNLKMLQEQSGGQFSCN